MDKPGASRQTSEEPTGDPARYWRSLEERAGTEEARERLAREFPDLACEWTDPVSRRTFLKLMGASLALAGAAAGCKRQPQEHIVPYVIQPEQLVPGRPLFYASAYPVGGYARGVLVEQHEGRPTKIEGNPDHPSSLGATDVYTQAAVLELYDPDRSKVPVQGGNTSSLSAFLADFEGFVQRHGGPGQLRLRVLTGVLTSPLLEALLRQLRMRFPKLVQHVHDPLARDNEAAGLRQIFGRAVRQVYDFQAAARVVSLDADFLLHEPGSVRYAREFAQRKRVSFKPMSPATVRGKLAPHVPTVDEAGRLYVAESTTTITGAVADHRLPVSSGALPAVLQELARRVAGGEASGGTLLQDNREAWHPWVAAVADDLKAHRGACLVLAGESLPPAAHAAVAALNAALGNVGKTVRYILSPEITSEARPLSELVEAMRDGQCDAVLILGANPGFTAPAELDFGGVLARFSNAKAPDGTLAHLTIHWGLHHDETAILCRWHLPASHDLEAWGDARGHDGTTSLIQPLIQPLHETVSAPEVLANLAGESLTSGYELLRAHWFGQWRGAGSPAGQEVRWRKALREGLIAGTASTPVDMPRQDVAALLGALKPAPAPRADALEINFRLDPHLLDGRYANNGWLQELPRPLTRLTWDNAALIGLETATALGLMTKDGPARDAVLRIELAGKTLEVAVWVQPGVPAHTVTLYLGDGRRHSGQVAGGHGFDVYPLRTSQALWRAEGARATVTGRQYRLACTQNHQLLEGRDIVRTMATGALGNLHPPEKPSRLSLYPAYPYTGYRWGMVIDQTACIGCNACVIACQSENNIPVVGKEQVLRFREMHWLRIDTYYGSRDAGVTEGVGANPEVHFQPMLCQHCEQAPCEYVCPVEATTHSVEGINEMTYNRCVGTRYCSNNCPYKVRRFNFLQFSSYDPLMQMRANPNVTVRSRGVMEKCNYCIQRINQARIDAEVQQVQREAAREPVTMRRPEPHAEPLPPLGNLTACQQACPTEAIIFGDLNDADAYAARLKADMPFAGLNYGALTELNTQPRTSYLVRLTNRNPALTQGGREGQA